MNIHNNQIQWVGLDFFLKWNHVFGVLENVPSNPLVPEFLIPLSSVGFDLRDSMVKSFFSLAVFGCFLTCNRVINVKRKANNMWIKFLESAMIQQKQHVIPFQSEVEMDVFPSWCRLNQPPPRIGKTGNLVKKTAGETAKNSSAPKISNCSKDFFCVTCRCATALAFEEVRTGIAAPHPNT